MMAVQRPMHRNALNVRRGKGGRRGGSCRAFSDDSDQSRPFCSVAFDLHTSRDSLRTVRHHARVTANHRGSRVCGEANLDPHTQGCRLEHDHLQSRHQIPTETGTGGNQPPLAWFTLVHGYCFMPHSPTPSRCILLRTPEHASLIRVNSIAQHEGRQHRQYGRTN